jgi:hypothetical protein
MNGHDQRLYRTMAEQLDQYGGRTIGLDHLIGGLDALLALLEGTDQSWRDAFRYEWGTLETVYAIALDRGVTQLSPENQALIDEAIKNMRRLLAERITAESMVGDS